MKRLTLKECKPFFKYFNEKFLEFGYLKPLKEFAKEHQSPLGEALLSWRKLMFEEGKSARQALRDMEPRFPFLLEDLLDIGISEAYMDNVLPEIKKIYNENDSEEELAADFFALLREYEQKEFSDYIETDEYFALELCRIVCRANYEETEEVIIEQDGDDFLHIKTEGFRPMHHIESSHRKIYLTALKKLRKVSQIDISFETGGETFQVKQISENDFVLTGDGRTLTVRFR